MSYNSITKCNGLFPVESLVIELDNPYGIKPGYSQSFIIRLLIVVILMGTLPILASATKLKVDAGSGERVIYPLSDSAILSGSGTGADGAVTYQWNQISGDAATIVYPNAATTAVTNLRPGLYTFMLTATDSSGIPSVDTTTVSVLKIMTWTVEGVTREALVHPSSGAGPAPVIFAFHGHGGSDTGFAEKGFELSWPEAIVVYPQGLPTWSNGDPKAKQSGWQHEVGEINSRTGIVDQDLKFFDAMLSTLKQKFNVDSNRVFVHGWSNGSEFVYDVLWATHGNQLAALAPASGTLHGTSGKQPLPVIHIAGTSDPKVRFTRQLKSVQNVLNLDQCSSSGAMWVAGASGLLGTYYNSSINDPVVSLQYDGGHAYPFTVPPLIVKFFKEVTANENSSAKSYHRSAQQAKSGSPNLSSAFK